MIPALAASKSRTYSVAGAALGIGAPLGLACVRSIAARERPTPRWMKREISRLGVVYGYTTIATIAVFALFGRALGRRQDAIARLHARRELLRERLTAGVVDNLLRPVHRLMREANRLHSVPPADGHVLVPLEELREIEDSAVQVGELFHELTEYGALDPQEIDAFPVDLRELVGTVVEELAPPEGSVALAIPADPIRVRTSPARLGSALSHLVGDAVHARAGVSRVHLTVDTHDDGLVRIALRSQDDAPWDPERHVPGWPRFDRARAVIEALGARLVASRSDGRTTVTVWLEPG